MIVNVVVNPVAEEVVDFEDWMVSQAQPDGITVTLNDAEWGPRSAILQQHPVVS